MIQEEIENGLKHKMRAGITCLVQIRDTKFSSPFLSDVRYGYVQRHRRQMRTLKLRRPKC